MTFTLRGRGVGPKSDNSTDRLRECYSDRGGSKFRTILRTFFMYGPLYRHERSLVDDGGKNSALVSRSLCSMLFNRIIGRKGESVPHVLVLMLLPPWPPLPCPRYGRANAQGC